MLSNFADFLDAGALDRLREIQRRSRGPSLTAVETRLLRLQDEIDSFRRDLPHIASLTHAEFEARCGALRHTYNSAMQFILLHEDAALRGWGPRRRLAACRELSSRLLQVAKGVRDDKVKSQTEIARRLSRALEPARALKPTQDGPISDQYYIEPIDSK